MLKLTLVTPTKKMLVDEEVEELFVPGHRGELNVLEGHATLITTLTPGVLRYKLKGADLFSYAAVSWGYCETFGDAVSILAETAELPKEIDQERSEAALRSAAEKLAGANLEPQEIEKYRLKFRRAEVRLEVKAQAPVSNEGVS